MIVIRKAEGSDFEQIWPILQEIFQKGETYTFSPDITREEVFHIWMEIPSSTYVATENELILGTYFLKPNQPGLGSHVCNVGYAVSATARGRGVGRLMCEHSLNEAKACGFNAMQYNCVVSTNQIAVELWKKCGFEIVGTLPKAFNHKEKGLVDAFVMYQWLSQ